MSYEGHSQFLCKKGHYWTEDCMSVRDDENICVHCSKPAVWSNMVNVTNGCYGMVESKTEEGVWKETEERIDGYIELELTKESKCDKCQSILEQTYKIPKRRGGGMR